MDFIYTFTLSMLVKLEIKNNAYNKSVLLGK